MFFPLHNAGLYMITCTCFCLLSHGSSACCLPFLSVIPFITAQDVPFAQPTFVQAQIYQKIIKSCKSLFFFKLTFLLENFITTQWIVLTQVINGYFAIEGEKCGKQTLTFLLTDFLNVFFSYMRDITWLADEDRELFVALSVIIQWM